MLLILERLHGHQPPEWGAAGSHEAHTPAKDQPWLQSCPLPTRGRDCRGERHDQPDHRRPGRGEKGGIQNAHFWARFVVVKIWAVKNGTHVGRKVFSYICFQVRYSIFPASIGFSILPVTRRAPWIGKGLIQIFVQRFPTTPNQLQTLFLPCVFHSFAIACWFQEHYLSLTDRKETEASFQRFASASWRSSGRQGRAATSQ